MFTYVFVVALVAMVLTKLWLAARQIRHVIGHRDEVPGQFAESVPLTAHRRAADYTVERTRLSIGQTLVNAAVLIGLTLLGGLQWLSATITGTLGQGYLAQIALIGAVLLVTALADLPFDYARHFVIEARYGFNRMTRTLFFADLARSIAVAVVVGVPLLFVVLWLMARAGATWWVWAWGLWVVFNIAVLALYPTLIAPLFNKFEPLADDALRQRIDNLMKRCGFAAKGLFVMDGSRRSAHGNAYFTGFGAAKRIVFFDTLLSRLSGNEIEAVLAHELGHFKRRHVTKRLLVIFLISLGLLGLLGWLAQRTWFYTGLGVMPSLTGGNDGLALILFMLVLPVFLFFVGPLNSLTSRKHEFEADAFAAGHAQARDLVSALVKLHEDNASTLTPDPLYTAFYYSHPPAAERVERLLAHPS